MRKITRNAPALIFAVVMAAVFPLALPAAVRLPAVIGDHMVVQQNKPVTIWGWAGANEPVTVRLDGKEKSTVAGADGTWRIVLDPLDAWEVGGVEHDVKTPRGPMEMTVRGGDGPAIVVRDILVGEVWICSGQSNMEWALSWLPNPGPEIMRADHPAMRLFLVPKRTSDRPLDDIDARWESCAPDTVRPFSAVAYFFGLELHERLGVPIGLIASAWGGTRIEPWTPPAGFSAVPEVRPVLDEHLANYGAYRDELAGKLPAWEAWLRDVRRALAAKAPLPDEPVGGFPSDPFDSPQAPTTLYNGMIHALTPFGIRGAIWYQGESNRNDGLFYEKKMEALIRGWREVWKLGDFPFYYVQLAPYNYAYDRESSGGDIPDFLRLPLIWEAQTNTLRIPHTGMAVITDIATLNDIHPPNKRDVGRRLALWARAETYGAEGLVHSGPLYRSMTVVGARVRLAFDHIGGGLVTNDGQPPTWFEIAGEDRVFYKAQAEIAGEAVYVWSPRVPAPEAVRFGWHQLAVPNLANKQGLPASPFRTDRW